MFDLTKLNKRKGDEQSKKRIGRGYGSGHGGHTSTRGSKGQKSRTGGKISPYFEGGQLRIVKRLPHTKGFSSPYKDKFYILKTSMLDKLGLKEVSPTILLKKGLFKKVPKDGIKLLFDTKVKSPVTLTGIKVSKSAKNSIEEIGGKVL
ncbi:50S ribosomal protein L15 [bacterium]|nr:50S ribosomal protein L15 [bacterium]